jgi:two-component system sensor histidine kinase ChvG
LLAPFGSLARRIVALNVLGLVILMAIILLFSPFQAQLIQSKIHNVEAVGEVIASSIASTTTLESDRRVYSPDLLEPELSNEFRKSRPSSLHQFPIRLDRLAPIVAQVVRPTGLRVRLYKLDGAYLLDSDSFRAEADFAAAGGQDQTYYSDNIKSFWTWLSDRFDGADLPVYRDVGHGNAMVYPEFEAALTDGPQNVILMSDERGRRTVTVLVPVQRAGHSLAMLLVSTPDGEIDKLIWQVRKWILWLGVVSAAVLAVCSLLLARTIASPLHALASAAERVQQSLKRREELPDMGGRDDEIGHLARALRNMTGALYRRIENGERFAADVAHELKNPLTSVRSAAETLTRVKSDADRATLACTIQNDVQRLTRLIDDISKATRADAEMALSEAAPLDLAGLIAMLPSMYKDTPIGAGKQVICKLETVDGPASQAFRVMGHESRLGQVFMNLVENALSFSPDQGTVAVCARRKADSIQVSVEDEGCGIPIHNLERIFSRFFTDRPAHAFGNNSGLGLSIAKEIVVAHGGRIWAENRIESQVQRSGGPELGLVEGRISGARLCVLLPAMGSTTANVRGFRARASSQR